MANSRSSRKSARKTIRRTEVNKQRKSRVHTYVRKVEEAIASGNKDSATESMGAAESEIMRAAGKGVFHKNTAARTVSRLTARVRAID